MIYIIWGIILIAIGVRMILKHKKKQSLSYEIVNGKIMALIETKKQSRSNAALTRRLYTPIFGFDYNGQSYEVEHNVSIGLMGEASENHKIGTPVVLRVNKENPNDAVLNTGFSTNLKQYAGIAAIICGVICLLLGTALTLLFSLF